MRIVDKATHKAFLRVQKQLLEVVWLCADKPLRYRASAVGVSISMMMVVMASGRRQSFDEVEEVLGSVGRSRLG